MSFGGVQQAKAASVAGVQQLKRRKSDQEKAAWAEHAREILIRRESSFQLVTHDRNGKSLNNRDIFLYSSDLMLLTCSFLDIKTIAVVTRVRKDFPVKIKEKLASIRLFQEQAKKECETVYHQVLAYVNQRMGNSEHSFTQDETFNVNPQEQELLWRPEHQKVLSRLSKEKDDKNMTAITSAYYEDLAQRLISHSDTAEDTLRMQDQCGPLPRQVVYVLDPNSKRKDDCTSVFEQIVHFAQKRLNSMEDAPTQDIEMLTQDPRELVSAWRQTHAKFLKEFNVDRITNYYLHLIQTILQLRGSDGDIDYLQNKFGALPPIIVTLLKQNEMKE